MEDQYWQALHIWCLIQASKNTKKDIKKGGPWELNREHLGGGSLP